MTRAAALAVFGEDAHVLLRQLGACASQSRLLVGDLLSLTITVPADAGGALRRAVLRAEAVQLRRDADGVGDGPFSARACTEREASALAMVARAVAERARAHGVRGRTVAERAIIHGALTAPPQ